MTSYLYIKNQDKFSNHIIAVKKKNNIKQKRHLNLDNDADMKIYRDIVTFPFEFGTMKQ